MSIFTGKRESVLKLCFRVYELTRAKQYSSICYKPRDMSYSVTRFNCNGWDHVLSINTCDYTDLDTLLSCAAESRKGVASNCILTVV